MLVLCYRLTHQRVTEWLDVSVSNRQIRISPYQDLSGNEVIDRGMRFKRAAHLEKSLKTIPRFEQSLVSEIRLTELFFDGCVSTKSQDIVSQSLSALALFKLLISPDDAVFPSNCNYGLLSEVAV